MLGKSWNMSGKADGLGWSAILAVRCRSVQVSICPTINPTFGKPFGQENSQRRLCKPYPIHKSVQSALTVLLYPHRPPRRKFRVKLFSRPGKSKSSILSHQRSRSAAHSNLTPPKHPPIAPEGLRQTLEGRTKTEGRSELQNVEEAGEECHRSTDGSTSMAQSFALQDASYSLHGPFKAFKKLWKK